MFELVFDVESFGLHGEGFAVGGVIIGNRNKFEYAFRYCSKYRGINDWVDNNCPPDMHVNCENPKEVRARFWNVVKSWNVKEIYADCLWPVEANFLSAVIQDDPTRSFGYPIWDITSIIGTRKTFKRHDNDLPKHDPRNDARHSARILVEYRKSLSTYGAINR